MTIRPCRLLLVCLALASFAAPLMAQETVSFAYLSRDNDPHYARHRLYTGLTLRDRSPPVAGARVAIRESRVVGRAIGVGFELIEKTLAEDEDSIAAIRNLSRDRGVGVFLLDLPIEDVKAAAAALEGQDLLLFNVRHGDDELRGAGCSRVLFHTLPSHAMAMDALAQYLRKKNWTEVLILEGQASTDKLMSAAFQDSARKFRLRIVDVRPFVVSNDPRLRDRTNIPILSGAADYDVVFLADEMGEFGRYVPYQTYLARPVVGAEGLIAGAWHWTWERHGAPQLNQRFDRLAERRMSAEDWAAWVAVRSVVESVVRLKTTAIERLREFLTSPALTLDAYKGTPANFRSWNNQLRQPILLHTHNAVIALAPIEGFLHEVNNLDTLGVDARESKCRFD